MPTPAHFRLLVPRVLFEAMIAHARAALPNECCGLLAGHSPTEGGPGRVVRALARYALENELQSPTEYRSEPRSMFEAMRDMRRQDIDVLAVYHSHPASAPVPSKKDLAQNYSEGVINLIVSLAGPVPEVRAWWLRATDYQPAEWELV
jgi:proteasome lid subunit RPN8/RPN11